MPRMFDTNMPRNFLSVKKNCRSDERKQGKGNFHYWKPTLKSDLNR